ncbi:sugar ABC transporter permease [Paraburkholderia sp. GAS42]|uniref:sugar ABC transporter permease n=1 Tax=Paraburkholderia sp. GAS42 TaxID=3035135 RepID=UPI003D1F558F
MKTSVNHQDGASALNDAKANMSIAQLRTKLEALGSSSALGGMLPVLISIVVLSIVFQSLNGKFLTATNLTNLMLQVSGTGTIAIGVVLVLLLGEIDLSVGALSGTAGALLGVLYVNNELNAVLAIVLVIVAALAWGAAQGLIVTFFRLPAFVVTLAALLALQGVQNLLLGPTITINFPYSGGVAKLTSTFLSPLQSWVVAGVIVACIVVTQLLRAREHAEAGTADFRRAILRIVITSAATIAAVAVLNSDRGVPLVMLLFIGIVVSTDWVIRRTVYGRHVMAVGGDIEAARRSGVAVQRIRISVFALGAGLAAFGGILSASRLIAATGSAGGGDILINAIAAAVIGGTSLFGGRGTVYSALLGILVIGGISNGMDLLNLSPGVKFVVTGAVLMLAVITDALAKRGRSTR